VFLSLLGNWDLAKSAFPGNHPENKALLNEVGARNTQWGRGGLAHYLYRGCWSEALWLQLLWGRGEGSPFSRFKPGHQKPVSGAVLQGRAEEGFRGVGKGKG
jgi:hypothetical protein